MEVTEIMLLDAMVMANVLNYLSATTSAVVGQQLGSEHLRFGGPDRERTSDILTAHFFMIERAYVF